MPPVNLKVSDLSLYEISTCVTLLGFITLPRSKFDPTSPDHGLSMTIKWWAELVGIDPYPKMDLEKSRQLHQAICWANLRYTWAPDACVQFITVAIVSTEFETKDREVYTLERRIPWDHTPINVRRVVQEGERPDVVINLILPGDVPG